jgi:hypothetical protein
MSWFFNYPSREAEPTVADVLTSAQAILKKNGFPLELLPKLSDDKGWADIESRFKMTLAQIMALKKYVDSQRKPQSPTTNTMPELAGEDFSASRVASLANCLQFTFDVTVLESLIGPGNSLFDLLPAVEPGTRAVVSKDLIASVVAAHRKALDDMAVRPDIDIELVLAIRMYTVKEPIPFYEYVNRVLNSPDRTGLSSIAPFMKLLIKALYAMDDSGYGVTTQAYRGVRIKPGSALEDKFNNSDIVFAPRQLLTFAGFTSVTRVASEAQNFGDYFFFHFLSVRGIDISSVSAYPQEMELLVTPPAVFRVGGACKLYGRLTVPLTHVEQENACYLSRTNVTTVSKEVRVCWSSYWIGVDCLVNIFVGTGCALQRSCTGQD